MDDAKRTDETRMGNEMTGQTAELRFAAHTDRGQVRPNNQDAFHAAPPPAPHAATHGHLFIVADGMGGHAAGEVASQIACEALREHYYASALAAGADPSPLLVSGMAVANQRIRADAAAHPDRHQMGTTCLAVVVRDGRFWVAHAGDSRLYLLHADELYLLTRDHNVAEELLADGKIDAREAATHSGQHILTRALGADAKLEPELREPHALEMGDRLLLCSDGLIRVVTDEEIAAVLTRQDPQQAVTTLVAEANRRGAPDNVTVVVIRRRAIGSSG